MSAAVLLWCGALLVALGGCFVKGAGPGAVPLPSRLRLPDEVRPGDLIFRRGLSAVSRAALLLDRNAPYSHVGIVASFHGPFAVIHATPDEPGDPGGVRAETLSAFLGSGYAESAALYRPRAGSEAAVSRAARIAAEYADRREPFDSDFDLNTPDRLYCTELVWSVYRQAGFDLVTGELPVIAFGPVHRRAVLPSTLLGSLHLDLVWSAELEGARH